MDKTDWSPDRQKRFDVILEAIKSQPYNTHVHMDDTFTFNPEYPEGTLSRFVDNTWIAGDADELFEHVANRVLEALDQTEELIAALKTNTEAMAVICDEEAKRNEHVYRDFTRTDVNRVAAWNQMTAANRLGSKIRAQLGEDKKDRTHD